MPDFDQNSNNKDFFPALRWHFLTPLYDFIVWASGFGVWFPRKILASVIIHESDVVVDIGCGTGGFLKELYKSYPNIRSYGIDPDPKLLRKAFSTLRSIGPERVTLIEGFSNILLFDDESINIIFITLTLHHMSDEDKVMSLKEMRRVLKPGGRLVLTDFAQCKMKRFFLFERADYLAVHIEGKVPGLVKGAGFTIEKETPLRNGSVSILVGQKP